MLPELWHHWLLLRPVLVFLLAGPLIVLAVLFRGRGESRDSQGKTEAEHAAPGAVSDAHPKPRAKLRIEPSPAERRAEGRGEDRRAA